MTPEFFPPPSSFHGEAVLQVLAPSMGLSIDPAHRAGTLVYLDFTARMAQFVMDFELPDTLEPAPVQALMVAANMDAGQTARDIAQAVKRKDVSAVEVARLYLERIEATDGLLNAFTDVTAERALSEAAAVDQALAAGSDPGPLAGVPYAVKNLFDIEGLPTLAGSKINRDSAPARKDATLVQRLRSAGAVLLGGLNMGEYAYDFTGENSHYGPTRNPHNPRHMTGGSSGGCGAAVAAAQVALALGSDINGSIRVPSSFCGLFGLKPTFGRLSRAGTFPFCPSLDHMGPFARAAVDLALAYDAMQGPDPLDVACTAPEASPVVPHLEMGIQNIRIAVPTDGLRPRRHTASLHRRCQSR